MCLTNVCTVQDKKLKELFPTIPSLDTLHSLGMDGLKADVILVDTEKDKKLSMLKQLSAAFKGLSSNPALVIKKIASLVSFHWPEGEFNILLAKVEGVVCQAQSCKRKMLNKYLQSLYNFYTFPKMRI